MPRDTRCESANTVMPDDTISMSYDNGTSTVYYKSSLGVWQSHHRARKLNYKDIKDMYPNFCIGIFTIKICNLRNLSREQRLHMEPNQIIVDRSTPLGNPYRLPRKEDGSLDEDMRDTVLRQYQNYFYDMVHAFGKYGRGASGLPRDTYNALKEFSSERCGGKYSVAQTGYLFIRWLRYIYKALVRYGNIELWDWCAPKHCHAETIVKYLISFFPQICAAHSHYQHSLLQRSLRNVPGEVSSPDDVMSHSIEHLGVGIANPDSAIIRVAENEERESESEREIQMPESVREYMESRLHHPEDSEMEESIADEREVEYDVADDSEECGISESSESSY